MDKREREREEEPRSTMSWVWLAWRSVLQTSMVVVAAAAPALSNSCRILTQHPMQPFQAQQVGYRRTWGGDDSALDFFAQEVFGELDERFDEHKRAAELGIMVEANKNQ